MSILGINKVIECRCIKFMFSYSPHSIEDNLNIHRLLDSVMQDMRIIEAEEKHIPDIVDLWIGMMNYHKELNPYHTLRKEAPDNWERYLRNMMAKEDAKVLAALSDNDLPVAFIIGNIKGYPKLFRLDEYGFVSDIYIIPEHRSRGLGQQMVKELFQWFDERSIERIELRVEPSNDQGYGFWKKMGFKAHVHELALDIDR